MLLRGAMVVGAYPITTTAASSGTMSATQVADLLIGISYFCIPVEIFVFVFRRRASWNPGNRGWLVTVLFILFILFCGTTHLLNIMPGTPYSFILTAKMATAIVSIMTAVVLCWLIPEALTLPDYMNQIVTENKLMRDFRAVTNTIRRVLKEDAILENARLKLRRVLPPNTLLAIAKVPPPDYADSDDLLTLPIMDGLSMHLRRSRLDESQVTWLHDICVQIRLALQQAATVAHRQREAEERKCASSTNTSPTATTTTNPPPPSSSSSLNCGGDLDYASVLERTLGSQEDLARLRIKFTGILSRIQTASEVLGAGGPLSPEQQRCLGLIQDACKSMQC